MVSSMRARMHDRSCTAPRIQGCGAALLAVAVSLTAFAPIGRAQVVERSRSDTGTPEKRDFGGTWDRYAPPQPGAAAAAPAVPTASGSGIPGAQPPGGVPLGTFPAAPLKEPYLTQFQAVQRERQEADARGEPLAGAETQCLPQGMPAMMLAIFPMEVLQTRGQLTIIEEAFNQVRRIYIGEDPVPIEDAEPGFYGHSTAKWEGDTLVVDTVGIKESVQLRNVPHSSEMRIHERIRKLDADHFEDRITVTDAKYMTGPWSFTWSYQRKPDYKMYEYVCDDNREFADPVTGSQRMRFRKRPE
jgi:hypothetical protein